MEFDSGSRLPVVRSLLCAAKHAYCDHLLGQGLDRGGGLFKEVKIVGVVRIGASQGGLNYIKGWSNLTSFTGLVKFIPFL